MTRLEDGRLLTGKGRFLADLAVPGTLHAAFVRAPVAHGRLRSIDRARARGMAGVVAVFTGADLRAGGVGALPCNVPITSHDGKPMVLPPRPVLPERRVAYVGEPVAVVIAESIEAARDAAEAVAVAIEALPVVTGLEAGGADIWPEAPGNVAFELRWGSALAAEDAFRRAATRVALALRIPRLIPNPLETRGALALPDGQGGLRLHVPNQSPHRLRRTLAETVLKMPETKLEVVATDVGGGFGGRLACLPEEVAVAWAALRLGRPVRWIADRSEGMLTDSHARDVAATAELALDGAGRFLALRTTARINQGAYVSQAGPVCALEYGVSIGSVYDIGAIDARAIGVFTNTAPTDVYRGVGRAEAVYVVERLVEAAARRMALDKFELRRKNILQRIDVPTTNDVGATYDSGDFRASVATAREHADESGYAVRRADSQRRGRLRGLGVSAYVHPTAGGQGEIETARLRLHPSGGATLFLGTHSQGQGHETVFARLVANRLGLAPEAVTVSFGDTGRDSWGRGTYGSRSLAIGGPAIVRAVDKIVAKGRRIAAHLLEASVEDVTFEAGTFRVGGTDRAVGLGAVARAAYVPHNFPHDELEPGLDEAAGYESRAATYPSGCHVAEVEVDTETGAVRLARYLAVDDVGVVFDGPIVDGQIHGGVVQGIGQALLEAAVHDPETGQLLAGSWLDYAMPRADDVVALATARTETPCRTNPFGVKGAGEAGPVAAPAAVVNAVLDALAPLGVTALDMPLTPERVWRAIREARGAS